MTLRKAVVLAGLAAATPAAAADLTMPPLSYPAAQSPTAVEVGTNWYVRGDFGASFPDAPSFTLPYLSNAAFATTTNLQAGQPVGFAGGAGFGYRATDHFRFDATWTYWQGPTRTRVLTGVCVDSLPPVVLNPYSRAPLGYLWDADYGCAGLANVRQHNNTFLANGYVDLGTFSGIMPYVGGGVGTNMNTAAASSSFPTLSGLSSLPATETTGVPQVWTNSGGRQVSPQPGAGFVVPAWTSFVKRTNWRFAWSLAAGAGIQLSPSFTLDIGYRYLNGGTTDVVVNPLTGLSVKQTAATQMVMVGLRFVPQ